ncbi:MAG: hypothetical protein QOD77_1812 [Thermoplasmata archaeon]|nr:hypothetical protein [Thermoplasmata archaeon]
MHPRPTLKLRLPSAALPLLLLLSSVGLAAPVAAEESPPAGCAPTGLSGFYQDDVVYLQWDATAGATAYDLYHDPGDGELVYFTTVYAPETQTYDPTVVAGRTYRYLATAYVDGIETQSCGPISVTTTAPPCAPQDFTATGQSDGILLQWTATEGATQYDIYRWDDTDPGGQLLASVQPPATQYFDGQTVPDVWYWYGAVAIVDGATTDGCGSVVAKMDTSETGPAPDPNVCAPADFTATPIGSFVQLSWTATVNASQYNIYRAREDGAFRLVILGDASTTSTIDTQVEAQTTYHYYATAEGGGVVTPSCGIVTVTTQGECSPMLTVTRGDGVNHLEWGFLPAAEHYNVYVGKNPRHMTLLASVFNGNEYHHTVHDPKAKLHYEVRAVVDGEERPACNTA